MSKRTRKGLFRQAQSDFIAAGPMRREVLRYVVGLAALPVLLKSRALAAITPRRRLRTLSPLVDVHCHLFNVTDLPAARFISIVKFEHYSSEDRPDPPGGIVDGLIHRIVARLSRGVPTAREEADRLDRRAAAVPAEPPRLTPGDVVAVAELSAQVEQEQRRNKIEAGFVAQPRSGVCETSGAGVATNLRTVLNWVASLRMSRGGLTDRLARLHRESGYESRLLCPALVDYSCWLNARLTSPLGDQVRAMKSVSLRPGGPIVHAYVPFDPLRDAMHRRGFDGPDGDFDPLAFVEQSLTRDGCIGVKLYPPMGFRPSGNGASGQRYPRYISDRFGGADALGRELDISLDRLWRLCERLDAPVMAHAANSVEAGPNYGERADPAYWMPAFDAAGRRRVMLGHFGRFRTMSAGQWPSTEPCPAEIPFERSWEGIFARHVRDHPDALVFADISYFSEVFYPGERRRVASKLREYLNYDPQARHLIFGSDWIMTGLEKQYVRQGGYTRRVATFLTECGFNDDMLHRVIYGNALRYLGLGASDRNRARLIRFHVDNGGSPDRLPMA